MKNCTCKDDKKGRRYRAFFDKANYDTLDSNESFARSFSLKEFSVLICKRCIWGASFMPITFALFCLMVSLFVFGINMETSNLWMNLFITAVRMLSGAVFGMIGIVVISTAIHTNYFVSGTIERHVRKQYADFFKSDYGAQLSLVEKRGEGALANLKLMVSVFLGSVAFWLIAPSLGAYLNIWLF